MKLKAKTKKMIHGSVTILMVIIMLPMMTFSGLVVDMSRVNMAKAMISSAGDLTMNSALANYDTILKDVYGLFAMSQTETDLAKNLQHYFEQTMISYGVTDEENAGEYVSYLIGDINDLLAGEYDQTYTNFMNMSFTVNGYGAEGSGLNNASVLRKQIVEYMKYRAPLEFGMGFLDALKSFQNVSKQTEVVEAQVAAQEKTQGVTQACGKLIKLIREYDELVKKINKGEQSLPAGDGTSIILENYDTQVDKYRSVWGDNYQHVNLLTLVFLTNSPTLDSVYLTGLNYSAKEYFVKAGGIGITYDGSGISISVQNYSNTVSAKTRLYNQMNLLNVNYKDVANAYPDKGFLSSKHLNYDYTDFYYNNKSTEEEAIKAFVAYEKFLKNQEENIKYSEVATMLEELYKVGKYYDNYLSLINRDIRDAENQLATAQQALQNAQDNVQKKIDAINGQIGNINTRSGKYLNGEGALSDGKLKSYASEIKSLLADLPTNNGVYTEYYSKYLKGTNNDIYKDYFNKLIDGILKKYTSLFAGSIIKAADAYRDNNKGMSFTDFMKDACGDDVVKEDLFKLLNCLLENSKNAEQVKGLGTAYFNAKTEEVNAEQAVEDWEDTLNDRLNDRNVSTEAYNNCLVYFHSFSTYYQMDAHYYSRYITTAQNLVTAEVASISEHFGTLKANIAALRSKLEAIEKQIVTAKTAVETYNAEVKKWETAKENYENECGSDSFSQQSGSDVEVAKEQYNPEDFDTLHTFVIAMWNEIDDFNDYLIDSVHYKYGSKKIDTIKTYTDAVNAVSSIKSKLSAVVTKDEANGFLAQLYNADTTPEYVPYTMDYLDPPQLCFLEPMVVPITILKYLNGAYPKAAPETVTMVGDDGNAQGQTSSKVESDYYAKKDSLTDSSDDKENLEEDKELVSEEGKHKYHYTYLDDDLSKITGLPSGTPDPKPLEETEMSFSKDENGDINASGGIGKLKNNLTAILGNIGKAINAGIENAYILTYLFENFSYNTIVQDTLVEAKDITAQTAFNKITTTSEMLKDSETVGEYIGKAEMLSSGYHITEYNNYLYGAELEYVLYGNQVVKKNVTAAKASIYAIRFAFNCIFAFTDSEIRTTTMSAGLAVQAATLGIVPYQVVQIILQLALAAAESAIDLQVMNCGHKVPVIKAKDTWSLSVSGAGALAGDLAAEAASAVITDLGSGLQKLVDATADELKDTISDVSDQLGSATKQAANDFVDQAFAEVMNQIEAGLNGLQIVDTIDETTDGVLKETENAIDAVENASDMMFANVEQYLNDFTNPEKNEVIHNNPLLRQLANPVRLAAQRLIDDMKAEVDAVIMDARDNLPENKSITTLISEKMNELKMKMLAYAAQCIDEAVGEAEAIANLAVSDVQNQINSYIGDKTEKFSKEAAEKARTEVTNLVNNYISTNLDAGNVSAVGGGSTSKNVASMIQFGYKDYLMLFTYISICVDDSAILKRTADLIQLNVQKAGENAEFHHKALAQFTMENAKTYIVLDVTAELGMFFMDLELFQDVLMDENAEGAEVTETPEGGFTIVYKGLLGY